MNLIKPRKWWYIISLIIITPGIISLILFGLKPSIDFTGGTLIEIEGTKDRAKIEALAKNNHFENLVVAETDGGYSLRSKPITEESHKKFKEGLASVSGAKEVRVETVGPSVSREITNRAFISIALASFLIVVYLAYAFRKVPKPAKSLEFGITAVIALLHDTLVLLGVFSLLGHFFGIEVDPLFITAVLTVIGFSVHDTIIIYDRIRENLIKGEPGTFEWVVNKSIIERLPRTFSTSVLVWIMLLVLYIFGGETIKFFVLALVIGIFSGTYSSIFNASPLLVTWQNFKQKRSHR
jgi:preprotein translocase subunit SecF